MKKFECACDIGSVLIGNRDWTFAVPNIGGDGTTEVRIYDSDREMKHDPWAKDMKFISSVQGKFTIFGYDCDYHELHTGRMTEDEGYCTLNGRYAVYHGDWKVAFVMWEDWT